MEIDVASCGSSTLEDGTYG